MRLRMADEDREKYGGPEELDFGDVRSWLDDLGYDELVAVEDQILADFGPAKAGEEKTLLWAMDQFIYVTRESSTMRMVRLRVWLALRAAGVDVALTDFRPARLHAVKVVRPDRDAVPPADPADSSPTSSPESDTAQTASSSASESSTDVSTPGPDEPTE